MCLYYFGALTAVREADCHGCKDDYEYHGCKAYYDHHVCEANYTPTAARPTTTVPAARKRKRPEPKSMPEETRLAIEQNHARQNEILELEHSLRVQLIKKQSDDHDRLQALRVKHEVARAAAEEMHNRIIFEAKLKKVEVIVFFVILMERVGGGGLNYLFSFVFS